jgi:hypothetical protein
MAAQHFVMDGNSNGIKIRSCLTLNWFILLGYRQNWQWVLKKYKIKNTFIFPDHFIHIFK